MFADIVAYIEEMPEENYKLIIGTDSQLADEVCFVTAIIVHRQGKGGRYYYCRERERIGRSLRQRIFYETARSLHLASQLAARLAENGHADLNVEIHCDVGGKRADQGLDSRGRRDGGGLGFRRPYQARFVRGLESSG